MRMSDFANGLAEQLSPLKFKAPLIAAVFIAPILEAFGTFVFDDWQFLIFLAVARYHLTGLRRNL